MLSYGFGAPFVLGGPLGASDPGCGTAELYSVLVRRVQYSTVQYSTIYPCRQDTGDCGGVESVEAVLVRNYEVRGGPSSNNMGRPCYKMFRIFQALE